MALLVDPPPRRELPAAARYPGSVQEPSPTLHVAALSRPQIFGRDGQQPDSTLTEWIDTAVSFWPYQDPYGSWSYPGGWAGLAGTGGDFPDDLVVAIELRTAAEVAAAGPGHGGDGIVFAVTDWEGAAGFPPLDGLTNFGIDRSGWSPETRFIRILIREDLAAGGAGERWGGRGFFIETLMHEFGHATMMMLEADYGTDYLVQNVCNLFGRPTSDFNDPDLPWGERVVEAAAEFYKDTVFPHRRYPTRAAYRLPSARFEDFRTLFFDYVEIPYWSVFNDEDLHVRENQFFENTGAASYVHLPRTVALQFVSEEFAGPRELNFTFRSGKVLHWPINGSLTFRWNFDPRPYYDPAGEPVPGYNWDDLDADTDEPRYIFGPPPEGQPLNYVNIEFDAEFWDLETTTFLGSFRFGLFGTEGAPIPPAAGSREVEIPAEILAAIPPEGCAVFLGRYPAGDATLPKFDLYPSDPGGTGEPAGLSAAWPWLEGSLQTARPTLRPFPYPIYGIPGRLTLGPPLIGKVPVDRKVIGTFG